MYFYWSAWTLQQTFQITVTRQEVFEVIVGFLLSTTAIIFFFIFGTFVYIPLHSCKFTYK